MHATFHAHNPSERKQSASYPLSLALILSERSREKQSTPNTASFSAFRQASSRSSKEPLHKIPNNKTGQVGVGGLRWATRAPLEESVCIAHDSPYQNTPHACYIYLRRVRETSDGRTDKKKKKHATGISRLVYLSLELDARFTASSSLFSLIPTTDR